MRRLTFEDFVIKANLKHKNKYAYKSDLYVNTKSKIKIICPKHGEFLQEAQSHLQGCGCPKCHHEETSKKQLYTKEKVIEKFKKVHGEKYSYDLFEYFGINKKSKVYCKTHGCFQITPSKHILGQGCPKCSKTRKLDTLTFIEKARKIHGDKYDYSKSEYKNIFSKICIICPTHGEFWQTPHNHINGKQGCPICRESHLENEIRNFLLEENIIFESQKRFKWLGKMSLDFYLPEYKIAIECQGKQHYGYGGWNDVDNLNIIRERDSRKRHLANENGIDVLYYSDRKYNNDIIIDLDTLLNKIRND